MTIYQVYGTRLHMDQALPGLAPAERSGAADWSLTILAPEELAAQWQSKPWRRVEIDSFYDSWLHLFAGDNHEEAEWWFHIFEDEHTLEFHVESQTSAIWMSWRHTMPTQAVLEAASELFCDLVLCFLLRRQGELVLHACALEIDDRAIIILGKSGSGKSTLASALALLDQPLLSEDVVVLRTAPSGFWVQPGPARIRLWPKSLAALAYDPATLTPVLPHSKKRYLPLAPLNSLPGAALPYSSTPRLASQFYWLEGRNPDATHLEVGLLSPAHAAKTLLDNRYIRLPQAPSQANVEFRQIMRLAKMLPVRRLRLPDGLDQLKLAAKSFLEIVHSNTAEINAGKINV